MGRGESNHRDLPARPDSRPRRLFTGRVIGYFHERDRVKLRASRAASGLTAEEIAARELADSGDHSALNELQRRRRAEARATRAIELEQQVSDWYAKREEATVSFMELSEADRERLTRQFKLERIAEALANGQAVISGNSAAGASFPAGRDAHRDWHLRGSRNDI